MRAGQRAGRAHDLVVKDAAGRILITARFAAEHDGRHINVVRRAADAADNGPDWPAGAVGCDVRTGALLYDAGALGAALNARKRRAPRQVGHMGREQASSRSVA